MKQIAMSLMITAGMFAGIAAKAASEGQDDVLVTAERRAMQERLAQNIVSADEDICWVAPEWRLDN
ncbi:MAG: hypothetical protein KDI88_06440 [Gammaproteobacteria bacterium]|nr:hypothetical protein [Gammaproteobacteria bacterium]